MGAENRTLQRVPHTKPPFTVGDLKKAIPPHCLKRSLIRSSYYLLKDLVLVGLFYYVAATYFHHLLYPLKYFAWALYMICQGCVMTGLWIIAHDCGHHAFSEYHWINNIVGFFIHTSLLTPYFSFKISHHRHHANTQSLDRDEVYVPRLKSEMRWFDELVSHSTCLLFSLMIHFLVGWPLYLLFNVSGRKYPRFANHFDTKSPIFSDRERALVLVSNAGIISVAYGLYNLFAAKGLMWVMGIYGVPWIIANGCVVLITYLHHTHPDVPHYDSSEWDWLRGALATVDRDYGIMRYVFHHIGDHHVYHHLFSKIPHYHGKEVTEALKPILGKYYHFDGTPILKAFWREAAECVYVKSEEDENKGVYWFDNKI